MNLASKASGGYAMAGLLVAMAVMAVLLSAALPAWSQMIRREKEEELIFRGNQYARAINLYQRKYANASPASLDVLIKERVLRKKFKDPMSPNKDGEFQLLYVSQGTGGRGIGARGATPGAGAARGAGAAPGAGAAAGPGSAPGSTLGTTPSGGIVGVASKNTGTSIRVLNGKTHYNEWEFVGMAQSTQAGTTPGGAQRGGQPGPIPRRDGPPPGGAPPSSRGFNPPPGAPGPGLR